ncbi:hypothetical protein ACSAZL_12515 [Methanosarcina sp. T3]|uniref:hypothetical protein n=1 Tax=Methanosarcina sp. T3 TaxID=3439062 RepID=UPI003F86C180
MKIPIELIRDSEEDNEPEYPEHPDAEKYESAILQSRERKSSYNDLSGDAERVLRSAPALSWKQFLKKWG